MTLKNSLLGHFLHNLNHAFTSPSKMTIWSYKPSQTLPASPLSGQNLPVPSRGAIRKTEDMYDIQSKSLLFTKLPVEVRNLIWDYVFTDYFGGKTVHLTFEENEKFTAFLCGNQFRDSCNSRAHGGTGFHDVAHWTGGTMPYYINQECPRLGWMGAVVSCRALYFETTKHIYSTMTFDLSDSWTHINNLQWLIPFHHLRHITKISITILDITIATNDARYAAWANIFTNLKVFHGLAKLRIQIATKETCSKAAISNQALVKVQDRLFGYMMALEARAGMQNSWELVLPEDVGRERSKAEEAVVESGWKVLRVAKPGNLDGLLVKFYPVYDYEASERALDAA